MKDSSNKDILLICNIDTIMKIINIIINVGKVSRTVKSNNYSLVKGVTIYFIFFINFDTEQSWESLGCVIYVC